MTFIAADLVARIRLDGIDKVGRDLEGVRGGLERTDSAASKVGGVAKAAFEQTALGIGAATVAATAFVTTLFGTGVAYNQLQQTSRAALTTLLGGAEAANAQMDKLDAFARTSPFSKSVFISAQQQLIGFGYSAEQVIPILNSVQNAVAAVGGSNEQISEIVSILAKIRSSGKLTAEDLNQLGERGLDAATLLGAGFGKTAAEIRESITEGTIDAGEAVNVLVAQMDAKFAGAADNVKNTFAGTTDRIKAATRDIGAELARPFVDPNGGGLAVDWGNQVADVLRAVQSQVPPLVAVLLERAAPAFAGITESLDRMRVQVRSFDASRVEDGLDAIADNAPGVAAVAGAILGVNTNLLRGIPILGAFVPAIGPVGGAIGAIALASPEARSALGDLLGAMQPLVPVLVDLASVASSGLNIALPVLADGIELVADIARPFVDIISAIPAPMLLAATAAIGVGVAMRGAEAPLGKFLDGIRSIGEQVAVQAALAGMEGNTSRFAGVLGYAGKQATGLGNSLKAAFISNPIGIIMLGVSTAAGILTAAFAAQAEEAKATDDRIAGYRDTLDQTTGSVLRSTRAQIEKNLADADADEIAKKLGLSSTQAAQAILEGGSAYDTLIEKLKELRAVESDSIDNETSSDIRASYEKMDALDALIKTYGEQRSAIAASQDEIRQYNKEQRDAAKATDELERSNTRMNEALAIARDVTRDAAERVKALKQALDELNGGAKTQADVTRDLNEQTDRLREVFNATNDAGEKLASGLVNAAGEIDTTSAAGRGLYDEVGRLNDQMLDAIAIADKEAKARGESGVSVEDARAIYEKYRGTLQSVGEQGGLSQEQIDGLIQTMLATPEVVAFALTDDGTIDANKLRLIDLATQILATPDKQFDVSNVSIPGLMDALRTLGYTVETLPDGTISVVKDGASFDEVAGALSRLVSETRTARIQAYVDLGPARYQLQQFAASAPVGTGTVLRASGGAVRGPGTSTSDSIMARLSNDEHVWTAAETAALGGHEAMYRLRAAVRTGRFEMPGFASGGAVRAAAMPSPAPVTYRTRTDPLSGIRAMVTEQSSGAPIVVYVQNPFTGEYLLGEVDERAQGAAAGVIESALAGRPGE